MKSGILGIVAVLSFLLIAGLVVMIYGIIQKSSNPDFTFFSNTQTPAPEKTVQAPQGFGDLDLAVPQGYRVSGTTMDAGRLAIVLSGPASDMILMFDMTSGTRIGTLRLKQEP